ncbi:hypothetical protein AB7092_08820 [Providencia rettgeri]|uniref:Cyanophage baseplate Pam3 plug gp18 domain-containing protein n=1 Tax=Providencia alcalifaciens DSM 30120 TaxID=520999 RepID=B6XJ91_9GAMM|nr:hypothetical protein [Providencia alcalifaciens]ATG17008.1 hypothetical protein CO695_12160 [Providencia alcalifaciens]EEB44628.1 hypothetical protein PROVALCAL_03442 [Providencia alcalifaciens DSM 30120]MTC37651.1 hypothetical protein [Providencia alcalifaciens]CAG9424342.1 hypothetical protein NVI2019_NGLDDFDA_02369 [Providencia alcalifaciens]SQI38312.1 Uncharacterised protein [Providencia alcalifaciens]
MQEIPLNAVPNQRLRVSLGDDEWELTIKVARSVMLCDIKRNDDMLIQGVRVMPNQPLIPYRYLAGNGNFAFITDNDELPWWEQFGKAHYLVWWGDDD